MATIGTNGVYANFEQNVDGVRQQILLLQNLKLPADTEVVQTGLEEVYQKIGKLQVVADLLMSPKNSLNPDDRTANVFSQRVDELRQEAHARHVELIEKGQYSIVHDKALNLMMGSAQKKLKQDTSTLHEMKEKWKEIFSGFKVIHENIARHNLSLSKEGLTRLDMLGIQIQGIKNGLIELPLFPKETIVCLLDLLELPAPTDELELKNRRIEIEACIQQLKPDLQHRLDFFVYLVSSSPKGGHEWGKNHRYDDLGILKKALGMAIWDHVRLTVRQERFGLDKDRVMLKFSAFAGGPAGNSEGTKKSALQWAIAHADSRPLPLCKAIWARSGQETFQKLLYSSFTKKNDYQPGFTVKGPFLVEKSPRDKILDMLNVVISQERVEDSVKRDYVKGCLEQLPLEQRYKVEEEVFHLSKDPWKGGKFWGRDHAYDNLSVLILAVKAKTSPSTP